MFDKTYLNYNKIVDSVSATIDYLTKKSDSFSVIAVIQKPYSQFPPAFNYDTQFQPFVTKYIFERNNWPADFFGRSKHQIMVVCRCCKESRIQLLQMPNVFLPMNSDMPEDICFYRGDRLWFATISHEKIAFVKDATKDDIDFFKGIGSV